MPDADSHPPAALLVRLAKSLQECGIPSHQLEDQVQRVSIALDIEANIFSLPTGLVLGLGRGVDQRTYLFRIHPGEIDLRRLEALETLAEDIAEGRTDADLARRRLDEINAPPPPLREWEVVLSFWAAATTASVFFGAGPAELAAASLVGLITGVLAIVTERFRPTVHLFEFFAASAAAFTAAAAESVVGSVSESRVVAAGLIVLLPGLSLTVGLDELAHRHLASGTSRLAGALVVLLQLVFGTALGRTLGAALPDSAPDMPATPLPFWVQILALPAFAYGMARPKRVPWNRFGWVTAACALAVAASRLGSALLGPSLGGFAGAAVLGTACHVYARVLGRSALMPLIPAMLFLVPGSIGYRSLAAMLDKDLVVGVGTAFEMGMVAMSLVAGLLIASALVPPRGKRILNRRPRELPDDAT